VNNWAKDSTHALTHINAKNQGRKAGQGDPVGRFNHAQKGFIQVDAMADLDPQPWRASASRASRRSAPCRRLPMIWPACPAEFKLELMSKTNLAESVAHKAHRPWDRVEHPAHGLVDNASQNFLFG